MTKCTNTVRADNVIRYFFLVSLPEIAIEIGFCVRDVGADTSAWDVTGRV